MTWDLLGLYTKRVIPCFCKPLFSLKLKVCFYFFYCAPSSKNTNNNFSSISKPNCKVSNGVFLLLGWWNKNKKLRKKEMCLVYLITLFRELFFLCDKADWSDHPRVSTKNKLNIWWMSKCITSTDRPRNEVQLISSAQNIHLVWYLWTSLSCLVSSEAEKWLKLPSTSLWFFIKSFGVWRQFFF